MSVYLYTEENPPIPMVRKWKAPTDLEKIKIKHTVFNLLEIAPKKDNTSEEAAEVFKRCWLSRYPRPTRCVHDNWNLHYR